MTHLVEVPRQSDLPGLRSDAEWVVDVVMGVLGASVGAGLSVVRGTAGSPALRAAAKWRPPFVPTRVQPATLLNDLARRGARRRVRAGRSAERLLDQWTPVIVEMIVSRVDLTGIVTRHVDLNAVVQQMDLQGMVEEVLEAVDLPAIIRVSTGSMASETVRSARMTGISVDEAISRSIERHLFRRRPAPTTTEAP